MKTADYDFILPEDLIALRPAERRDVSRLLVLSPGGMEHRRFCDLADILSPGDMLILNDTKVFPARIVGRKPGGGILDILLVKEEGPGVWEIMSRGRYTGPITVDGDIQGEIEDGKRAVFAADTDLRAVSWKTGLMPLPPYIRRQPDDEDRVRYQTVYASSEGSIAAPTAGLHFTDALLGRLAERPVLIRKITLHVGIGTFRPIRADNVEDHRMDSEHFELDPDLISEIRETKARGNRVVAVGTTTTRALEAYASGIFHPVACNGKVRGHTDIFISEGYRPQVVDSLITNFHLPRSTPLMLASAFAGRLRLLSAYNSAISMGYRFFSYGDAMLVL